MNRRNEPEGMRPFKERSAALKKFRNDAGLTQEELAKLADLSESTISRFESEERDLSPAAFARVQEVITDFVSEKKALERIAALRGHKSLEKLISPQALAQLMNLTVDNEDAVLSQMSEEQRKEFLPIFEARKEEMQNEIEKLKSEKEKAQVTVEDLEKHLREKVRRIETLEEHVRHLTDPRTLAERRADLEARMTAWTQAHFRLPNPFAPPDSPNSLLSRLLNGEPPAQSLEEQLDRMERGYQMTELRQLVREEEHAKREAEQAERIAKLEKQNSSLLEWLTAEERAALAHEKASELNEKASHPSED
jgi:transcriptional regulator with XRE-family HTH domain